MSVSKITAAWRVTPFQTVQNFFHTQYEIESMFTTTETYVCGSFFYYGKNARPDLPSSDN